MDLYITVTTVITLWSCPPNVQLTTINQCKAVQMEQSSQAPTLVPPHVTPAKEQLLTYTASGPDTTLICGHPANSRNKSGCYDTYTPHGTR